MTTSVTGKNHEVLTVVGELLNEIADVPLEDVKPESHFREDLDVDSLLMVEFGVALEDRLGVLIPDEEFSGLQTVGDLVAFVEKAQAE